MTWWRQRAVLILAIALVTSTAAHAQGRPGGGMGGGIGGGGTGMPAGTGGSSPGGGWGGGMGGSTGGGMGGSMGGMGGRIGATGMGDFPGHLPERAHAPLGRRDAAQEWRNVASGAHQRAAQALVRQYPERFELDLRGQPMLRGELLLAAPSDEQLQRVAVRGFTVLRRLDAWPLPAVALGVPPGLATPQALELAAAALPEAVIDFNHVYLASGEATGAATAPVQHHGTGNGPRRRVGMIDGPVEPRHPVFDGVLLQQRRCAREPGPLAHGTAVASVLVMGLAADSVELYTADVTCGHGAADVIVAALGWLAEQRVPVINISLVGPDNRLLRQAIAAMVARGHIIVAAVGNDGPAAPPLYPAAYPGVVAVTGIDGSERVLLEAGRGLHVSFAAAGAEVDVADPAGGVRKARGTSFSAPAVAAMVARLLSEPSPALASRAVQELVRSARDLGEAGRDPVYGHGLARPPSTDTAARR